MKSKMNKIYINNTWKKEHKNQLHILIHVYFMKISKNGFMKTFKVHNNCHQIDNLEKIYNY